MCSNRSSHRSAVIVACAGAAAALVSAGVCRAEPVQMVLGIGGQLPTSTKSAIPGTIPVSGTVGTVADPRFTNFGTKLNRSATSNLWIVVGTTNLTPTAADQVLVIGSGMNIVGGAVAAREGVTQTATGDLLNFSGLSVPRVNDSGQWVMSYQPAGGTSSTQRVAKWDGSALTTAFQPNDVVTANGGTTILGPFNFGTSPGPVSSAQITSSGSVSFLASVFNPTIFTNNGSSTLFSVGTDFPTGQVNDETTPWSAITNFSQNSTGTSWVALGKVGLDTTKDVVAVRNGVVMIQKGSILPGSGFASAVSTITDAFMESNGDWYARGLNADNTGWVTRNGAVVAISGGSVVPGSSEHWKTGTSSPFIDVRGNNAGNFVIVGNTDNATATLSAVIVLNGVRVLARSSDPVDVGDGVTPANSFFLHTPFQNAGVLNNDGYYYFFSRMKATATGTSGTGTSPNNQSILRVFACPADYNQSGSLEVQDIFDFLNGWFAGSITADFNRNGSLAVQDIFDFLNAWFGGC